MRISLAGLADSGASIIRQWPAAVKSADRSVTNFARLCFALTICFPSESQKTSCMPTRIAFQGLTGFVHNHKAAPNLIGQGSRAGLREGEDSGEGGRVVGGGRGEVEAAGEG